MNAVIYARYSPGPRQTEQSIEGQVRDCEAYARDKGIKVINIYADRHISGTDFERRAEFNRMIADSERHKFDAIIVWKVDRFGRDREEIALNKIKLKRNGIKLLYAKEVIPDGPEGIILESLMEGLAEDYVADLLHKVTLGLHESALKGLAVSGKAAFGYSISPEKKYVVNEEEAWAVRWIFEKFAAGMPATQIVDELKKKGVKSHKGTFITKNGVYTILRNEKYLGKCFYSGVPVPLPQLVSQDLWDQCHAKFVSRPRSSATFKAVDNYALALKMYCGECGSLMIAESGHGKSGKRYCYYKCSNRKKNGKKACCSRSYKRELIEDYVALCTIRDVLQDDVIDYIADKVIELLKRDSVNDVLNSLKKSLKEAERSRNNILKAIEDGIYTSSTKDRLIELESDIENYKVEISREEIKKPDITNDHVLFWLERFKKGNLKDADFLQRLFDVFIHSVFVYEDKVVIAYNYARTDNSEPVDISKVECSDTFVKVDYRGLYPNIYFLQWPFVFLCVFPAA